CTVAWCSGSESIKEPRGRSRSQSYSQIALLHSHLFLHDQLTFADISGTDTSFYPTFRRSILAGLSFTRGTGLDRASAFSHNARVEGLAEVLSVTKQPVIEVAEGVEAGGSYAIEAM